MKTLNDYLFECEKSYIENLSNDQFAALSFDKKEHNERLEELINTQAHIRRHKAQTKEDKAFFRYPNRVTAGVFGVSISSIKTHSWRKCKKNKKRLHL